MREVDVHRNAHDRGSWNAMELTEYDHFSILAFKEWRSFVKCQKGPTSTHNFLAGNTGFVWFFSISIYSIKWVQKWTLQKFKQNRYFFIRHFVKMWIKRKYTNPVFPTRQFRVGLFGWFPPSQLIDGRGRKCNSIC